jgi:hypothetical protein
MGLRGIDTSFLNQPIGSPNVLTQGLGAIGQGLEKRQAIKRQDEQLETQRADKLAQQDIENDRQNELLELKEIEFTVNTLDKLGTTPAEKKALLMKLDPDRFGAGSALDLSNVKEANFDLTLNKIRGAKTRAEATAALGELRLTPGVSPEVLKGAANIAQSIPSDLAFSPEEVRLVRTYAPELLDPTTKRPKPGAVQEANIRKDKKELELEDKKLDLKSNQAAEEKITEDNALIANQVGSVNEMINLLKTGDVETGFLAQSKTRASEIARSFGFDDLAGSITNAPSNNAFNTVVNSMVLRIMQAQTGPQTDNDRAFIQQTLPSLGNTPASNQIVAELMKDRLLRQQSENDFLVENIGKGKKVNKLRREYQTKFGFDRIASVPKTSSNASGLLTFSKFEQAIKAAAPEATEDQIISEWKKRLKKK